jgi:hypothetical protein
MQKFGVEAFIDGLTLKELSTAENAEDAELYAIFSAHSAFSAVEGFCRGGARAGQ